MSANEFTCPVLERIWGSPDTILLIFAGGAAEFAALLAIGQAMNLQDLPTTYAEYRAQRHRQLLEDYARSLLSDRLNEGYRAALGPWRYWLLRRLQADLIPGELQPATGLRPQGLMAALLRGYRYLPGGGNKLRRRHGLLFPAHVAAQLGELAVA